MEILIGFRWICSPLGRTGLISKFPTSLMKRINCSQLIYLKMGIPIPFNSKKFTINMDTY